MSPLLQKILQITRKTGDRVIIMDSQKEEAFVLMDLASYERLLGSSNPSLTTNPEPDNIKSEISQNTEDMPPDLPISNPDIFAEPSGNKPVEEERFYIEPIE